jgi:hypothetical protein
MILGATERENYAFEHEYYHLFSTDFSLKDREIRSIGTLGNGMFSDFSPTSTDATIYAFSNININLVWNKLKRWTGKPDEYKYVGIYYVDKVNNMYIFTGVDEKVKKHYETKIISKKLFG